MRDFLLICDKNCATYKEVFPLFKQGIVSFGSPVKEYEGTDRKFGNHGWITTFPVTNKKKLILTATYDPELYPMYDNYDAIEVSRIKNIPYDYDGVMGCPITILDYDLDNVEIEQLCASHGKTPRGIENENCYLNGEWKYPRVLIKKNFEIDGCLYGDHTIIDGTYIKGHTPEIDGKHKYARILIKKNFEIEGLLGNFREEDCNETTGFVCGDDVSAYNLPGTQNGPVVMTDDGPEAKYKRILIKKNFEIMGMAAGNSAVNGFGSQSGYTKHKNDRGGCPVLDDERIYTRILIRRKL